MGTLLLYLASAVIAGVTIHLFTGNKNRHPELKQLGIAAVHGLLALEAAALAVMLVIGVLATPATDNASPTTPQCTRDAPPSACQSSCPTQQGKSPNVPATGLADGTVSKTH